MVHRSLTAPSLLLVTTSVGWAVLLASGRAPSRLERLHPINFPLATSTTAFGINDTGEIAGFYTDAASNSHGFVCAGGAFSTVDVAGARGTQLTRIKNGGRLRVSAPTP